jgi:hypothetical protein
MRILNAVVFFVLAVGTQANAADPVNERIATIKAAAIEIRGIQKQEGNLKALANIDECYGRVMRPGVSYGKEVEICLAKDYVVASLTAAFYSQLSAEGRKANNLDPKRTIDEMRRRLIATFTFFGIAGDEAAAFGKLLFENALQALQAAEQ